MACELHGDIFSSLYREYESIYGRVRRVFCGMGERAGAHRAAGRAMHRRRHPRHRPRAGAPPRHHRVGPAAARLQHPTAAADHFRPGRPVPELLN